MAGRVTGGIAYVVFVHQRRGRAEWAPGGVGMAPLEVSPARVATVVFCTGLSGTTVACVRRTFSVTNIRNS